MELILVEDDKQRQKSQKFAAPPILRLIQLVSIGTIVHNLSLLIHLLICAFPSLHSSPSAALSSKFT
jgi:hypothetical protein